ncbi:MULTISPECIES: trigger factor [Methylovorus]|jgi:trigger factor|uniref:Trigger factor n=1 Tax=Methylovorus glucosotrophus (strain SIP3-4) TaxID=582744 RepID=C6XDT2_METGS|nr:MULTISPECIES: trigger factor [Methylovorus]ACT50707.1 trigger factor [Methylovorus glucosotrophus SIP3-4]ADQ84695.1 trigger factor [Methylovorus sp. MP688]KAF0843884.1 trigger factor [Methylovorus glucosotrophus]
MAATVETISNLERRITVSVPLKPIEEEVTQRINRLARTAKLPGFRPGKVPMKLVYQQYGAQVRDEVFSGAVERTFTEAVQENKLRVAGYPNIEPKQSEGGEHFEYVATFEVFPEFEIGDLSKVKIERPVLEIGEADVKKTTDVLLKQRATYEPVKRASKKGDKVNIALRALIDGNEVERTSEQGLDLILGEGGRVAEFDDQLIGNKVGSQKTFDISYPADHKPEQLAGKTVTYEVTFNTVQQAKLPELDADFARGLGVEDGDVEKMKAEIKQSLEQEVAKRVRAKVKEQVFQALIENVALELPKAIIEAETNRVMQATQNNLQQRGVDVSTVTLDPAMFEEQAKRNASLRLILSELVNKNSLQANAEQVRAMVDQFAQSFERPEDVVRWYYDDPKRLDEPASLATEENVVNWVLQSAKVSDKKVKFDDLMGNA